MQRLSLQNAFVFLLLFQLFSCKKDDDQYGPAVTIHTPVADQSFNVFDNITVSADITDDTRISSVTIALVNRDYTPVHTGIHVPVTSPTMALHTNYLLDNIHLETGLYYLSITASDGKNDSHTYQSVYITEVPKALKKIFVATSSSISATNLSVIDSSFSSITPYHSFTGDYLGTSASSYYQQVYMCGNYTGAYTAIDLQSNAVKFSVAPMISGNPYFVSYYSEDKKNYISKYDGTVKGFNNSGDVVFTAAANAGYYVDKLTMNDGHLVASEQSRTSAGKLLVTFFSTGSAEKQTALSQDVVAFCEQDEDNVFMFGNIAGQGVIQLFDRVHNNIWNPYNYSLDPGTVTCAVKIDSNTYLIGHSNGNIYKYKFMSSSVTTYLSGYNAIQLKYDELNNRVYVVEQNRISAIDYPSATFINAIASAENIKDISLLYNR